MPAYLIQDLIQKKRDGGVLDPKEIGAFIEGITNGDIPDAQIAALAMAVWFQGMNRDEVTALTLAMRDSGSVLRWENLDGPVVDKHSTGGVGDLVSLVLGPMVASCGAFVPMISGRGLGHTGGTLDKLESIPGFETSLGISRFQSLVRSLGIAIIGQTENLVPADRRFYAVRDVTATVGSVPLIVASILSKKLSEGLDGLVMDVKVGSGAFMDGLEQARNLARSLNRVSGNFGLPCTSLITDMNYPLANSAGNTLEVLEAIEYLKGERRHPRLDEVVRSLGAEMLLSGGLAANRDEARAKLKERLDSGSAAEFFARMVAGQGGPVDLLERPDRYLQPAPLIRPVFPKNEGFVKEVDTRALGMAVVDLGGGRRRAEDPIDPAVGLSHLCTVGQPVGRREPLAMIHAASESDVARVEAAIRKAMILGPMAPKVPRVVLERVE